LIEIGPKIGYTRIIDDFLYPTLASNDTGRQNCVTLHAS